MSGFIARVARAPSLHFIVLGALLFAVSQSAPSHDRTGQPVRPLVVFTAADMERIRRDWTEEYGIPPNPAQEERLIEDAIDEEILHREALAIGLQHDAPVIRQRLVQLARFLEESPNEEADDALEREARALGLDRTDIVIRRYLVQSMRLLAKKARPSDLPTERDLEAYFAAHRDEYIQPERIRMTHVYLSRERRGPAVADDATRLLETLRGTATNPGRAASRGEPFVRGADIGPVPHADLDRIFGPGFSAAIATAEPQSWVGPVPSAYGFHLVWIHERLQRGAPPLDAVRNRVVHRYLRERREERLQERLRELRARYDVRILP